MQNWHDFSEEEHEFLINALLQYTSASLPSLAVGATLVEMFASS